jgi:hypothetical protein
MLYRLTDEGVVQKDGIFQWSLCASGGPTEAKDIAPSRPERVDLPNAESSPTGALFSLPAQIGHWVFNLNTEASTGRVVWNFRCLLCGAEVIQVVRSGYAVWLWPKIRTQRVNHDETAHPEALGAQAVAEKTRFGPPAGDLVLAPISVSSGAKSSSRPEPNPVDELMRTPVGRRLMRGFSILKGNR